MRLNKLARGITVAAVLGLALRALHPEIKGAAGAGVDGAGADVAAGAGSAGAGAAVWADAIPALNSRASAADARRDVLAVCAGVFIRISVFWLDWQSC